MNIKKRISEIVLLTLAVVVGGGYIYYSLLTNSNDNFNKNTTVVFNDVQIGSSNNKPGSIYSKKPQRTASGQHNTTTSGVSGLQLPSLTELSAVGSHESGVLSGSTGYSYSYNAKTRDKINPSTSGTGIGGMLAYGSSGRGTGGDEQTASVGGGGVITAPGATTPFAVPLRPESPTGNTNGLILVDPGTNTITGDEIGTQERIPVGEGGWLLLLLVVGYAGWKRTGPPTP